MKKLVLAAALVVMSFGVQAQEMHEDNELLLSLCASNLEKAQSACKSTMIGFKFGFLYTATKSVYLKNEERGKNKESIKVVMSFREQLAERLQQIDSDDMVLEYVKVLKRNEDYRSMPADFALGQAITNLLDEVK